jgi:Asp-tRNA(Asn)/Glu-tRNA(Gln) amidotransferase A subunit family amidase
MRLDMGAAELAWLSALELARRIRGKEISPVEVMEALLDRVAAVNPGINAYCTVAAEEARDAATAAEVAILSGEPLGPLHGVPVSVKDLIFTRRLRTTAGSRLLADHVPDEDAVSVERLRGAGAVIVGKTNTPEFGFKGVTDNPLFGVTRNPWDLARTPGGSSGGAAAAVASFCGIYGLKPSFGRVPSGPGLPGWETLSHTGPLTRTVRDAALMLDVLAGPDDRDRHSLPATAGPPFLAACEDGIAGLSVAWSADLGHGRVESEVADLCADAAVRFESLGCHVEVVVPTWDDPEPIYRTLAAGEAFAAYRDRLDAGEGLLDPALVELLRFGETITADQYLGALLARREFWGEVQRFLARFDLLITPTVAVAPFAIDALPIQEIDGTPVSRLGWTPFTYPFNLTGQPAASVPAGVTASGLPVGLQIVGRRHADRTVLAASAAWEAAAPWHARRPDLG